jgi:hypothetical protein
MHKRMKQWIAIALSGLTVALATFAFAEDKPMTQGEAAVVLAQRLGLGNSTTKPLTPGEAVRLLMENKISPFGGWQLAEPLLVRDLARVLVQALGRANQIPAEERENPDSSAYVDLLTRDFNLDLSSIAAALSQLGSASDPSGLGLLADFTSSDPLRNRGEGGEPDESVGGAPGNINLPVNLATFSAVVNKVPSRGGGGGGGDEEEVDTTPNVPPQPEPSPEPSPTIFSTVILIDNDRF